MFVCILFHNVAWIFDLGLQTCQACRWRCNCEWATQTRCHGHSMGWLDILCPATGEVEYPSTEKWGVQHPQICEKTLCKSRNSKKMWHMYTTMYIRWQMWQVLGDKCVAGSAAWVSWWARNPKPQLQGLQCSTSETVKCRRLSEVQIRHLWLCFVEDLDHVDLKLVQSPKRVHQNQQTGPGDSGCTWFLQLFRPGPHHNPFNEFKTKEIDNYSSWIGNLMYLNVFYVV